MVYWYVLFQTLAILKGWFSSARMTFEGNRVCHVTCAIFWITPLFRILHNRGHLIVMILFWFSTPKLDILIRLWINCFPVKWKFPLMKEFMVIICVSLIKNWINMKMAHLTNPCKLRNSCIFNANLRNGELFYEDFLFQTF